MQLFANFNWIDWTIIAILIYYAFAGWQAGFTDLVFSFLSFLIALALAIKFHAPVGNFLAQKFAVPTIWTTVFGYVVVGFIAEVVLAEISYLFIRNLPQKLLESKLNKLLGIVVSVCNGLILIAFFLLVILALPLQGTIKSDVNASEIGSYIVSMSEKYGAPVESTIKEARDTASKFMTVEPGSTESIALNISVTANDLKTDTVDETAMLVLVNAERAKVGVAPLAVNAQLVAVARAHSTDMYLRKYFSHVTPEGLSPADRLDKAGISYLDAGENLAYAPDLATAHTGLMNSPGHRANILDPAFHHVGIGIISTTNYGIMVTQDFTN
jgi:uncharacterized protein YkwD/uncharacterized membrane protein required for colicin V production